MTISDEDDFDNAAECYKDQCEKEGFEEQEERTVTDQEWEEEKTRREEEQFFEEQERNLWEINRLG